MNVHLLRRLRSFVVGNFHRHPEHYDERNDPTRDIDGCVRLIHARIVGFPRRDRRRGNRLHPVRCVVVCACFLIYPVPFELTAEAQETRPAAVTVIGVVALELFVILSADVVVAQTSIVVTGDR